MSCPFSGSLTAYYLNGIPVQTSIPHHSGACCADAPSIPLDITVGTAAKNATIVSGLACASILSDSVTFNTNLLTSFQRTIALNLPCLSLFTFYAYLLEWRGGVTGRQDSSLGHPSRHSLKNIATMSGVDVTHQCSAPTQEHSERPENARTPFDLSRTPTR